jgi:hypothetical protein
VRLSPEQLTALRAAAEGEGVDPDALIKAAESELEDEPDEKPESEGKSKPPAEAKIFQYHLPFLRVNELRAFLGLPTDAPGGDQFCGQWLATNGGVLAGPTAAKPDTPSE